MGTHCDLYILLFLFTPFYYGKQAIWLFSDLDSLGKKKKLFGAQLVWQIYMTKYYFFVSIIPRFITNELFAIRISLNSHINSGTCLLRCSSFILSSLLSLARLFLFRKPPNPSKHCYASMISTLNFHSHHNGSVNKKRFKQFSYSVTN